MARWIALLVDLLGFVTGILAWELIVWGPPAVLCILWYTGALRENMWLVALVILPPMFGLLLLWVARGLYNRKLGRLILVVCCSAFGVLSSIFAVVIARLSPDIHYSPWGVVPGATLYIVVLAIAVSGIAKRKAIKDQI